MTTKKIIARANELEEYPIKLSRRFCEEFHHDMKYLNCLPPSVEPRLPDHMPQIIDMIKQVFVDLCFYFSHPMALRLFLIGTHYRSPIYYSELQLESASDRLFYIYQYASAGLNDSIPPDTTTCILHFRDECLKSMLDDLHTTEALAAMSEPLKTINDLLDTRKLKKQELRIESLAAIGETIRNVLTILGLVPDSYSEALQQLKDYALKRAELSEDQVEQKIEERNVARKNKEYEKSDAIRKDLAAMGIALMDSPDGTTWRPAIPLALQEPQLATT